MQENSTALSSAEKDYWIPQPTLSKAISSEGKSTEKSHINTGEHEKYYSGGSGMANRSVSKVMSGRAFASGYEPAFGSPLDFQDVSLLSRSSGPSMSQRNGTSSTSKATPIVNNGGLLDAPLEESSELYKTAVIKTLMSILSAVLFGAATWIFLGQKSGMEFFAGYLVEQSLSVDNLFVFIMLFDYFAVPIQHQSRVLTWGIIGAVVMRGIMIGLGVAVVKKFNWIIIIFAGILLVSSWKLLQEDDEDHDLSNNTVVKIAKKLVDAVDEYDGDRFFTSKQGSGKRVATPLLLCLVCIELSDFVFAVDSIPAVLGVSQDPFVVYSSNIFAIMGLRSVYTLIAKAIDQLPYLKPSVALVLGFVGFKMILEFFHFEISTGVSLLVVALLIGGGILLSIIKTLSKASKRKNSDSKLDEKSMA